MTTISINGVVCVINGDVWRCADKELLDSLPRIDALDLHAYYPSIERALVDIAVQQMRAVIVNQSPLPDIDPDTAY